MGKPPAIVIVARHGARLDAADKQWHLTSPTPYDPPLTFGGWTQARALGTRIANILHARDEQYQKDDRNSLPQGDNPNSEDDYSANRKRKHRRHRIIIHTSPFVRCIQTSIAVSAGIGQNYRHPSRNHGRDNVKTPYDESNREKEVSLTAPGDERSAAPSSCHRQQIPTPSRSRLTTLRVDAFLGEWLSPDYYEHITPPPSSVMMVAGAKSELLRPGEALAGFVPPVSLTNGNFPGGWNGNFHGESSDGQSSGLGSFASLSSSLPYRSRASTETHSDIFTNKGIRNNIRLAAERLASPLYNPPSPAYAISSSEPIPIGYVAHARDACIDVDYQWDSMRPPYEWGDGGEYGEEWSSMHKRFRKGLENMISWYKSQDAVADGTAGTDEVEDDTETVLILVTHGAGCNALIGALTNQPVLLDVGMASLTMAERKPTPIINRVNGTDTSSPISRRRTSLDNSLATEYDVKVVASTEHLRGRSTVASPILAASPRKTSVATSSVRRTYSPNSPLEGISLGEPLGSKLSPGNRTSRGRNTSLGFRWGLDKSLRLSSGLWDGTPATPSSEDMSGSVEESMPNFDRAEIGGFVEKQPLELKNRKVNDDVPAAEETLEEPPVTPPRSSGLWGNRNGDNVDNIDEGVDEGDIVPESIATPKRAFDHGGLWNSTDSPIRSAGPKRRWTVTHEHGS